MLPDDCLRLIGSFVPWEEPDFGSRARMVCRAMRDGVDDTAREFMFPAQFIPTRLHIASAWHKAMFTRHGMCAQCTTSPAHMTYCEHVSGCKHNAALCLRCQESTQQGSAQGQPCGSCSRWYCTDHFKKNRAVCGSCGVQTCMNCNDFGSCTSCWSSSSSDDDT